MKALFLLKRNTPLYEKVQSYHKWKYSGKRYLACISVMSNGNLKGLSVGEDNDHFFEWFSPKIVNSLK